MGTDRDVEPTGFAHALAELRSGRLENADALTRGLLRTSPRSPALHQLASGIALQDGRYRDAIAWAVSCLEIQPLHAPVMLVAGRAARAAGDMSGAANWYKRAWQASPGKPEALFGLCVTQFASADPTAQTTLEQAQNQFPDYAEGWNDIGKVLRKAGQLDAAAVAFAMAANVSADPAHSFNHGTVLMALDRHGEAVAAFQKALAADPDFVPVLLPLAQCLRIAGALTQARQFLERLARLQPGNAHGFFALALACDDMHDLPMAIAAYGACIALQPEWPEAHVNLGMARQQAGELASAIQSYAAAVHLRPDTFARIAQAMPSARKGQLWLNLGKLRRSLGG